MMAEDKRKRRLKLAADEPGDQRRHPDDGFELADPRPMGRRTLRVLDALVEALLPPPPAPRSETTAQEIALHVRVMMQYMPPLSARGLLLVMHLLDWSPLWRGAHLRPLTRLSAEEGSRVLAGVADSRLLPLRLLMLGPKGLILSSYFDRDEVHAALDYDPRGFILERIELRRRLMRGAQATADDFIPEPAGLGTRSQEARP